MRGDAVSSVVQAAQSQALHLDRQPALSGRDADRLYHDQIAQDFDASYEGEAGAAYTRIWSQRIRRLGGILANDRVLDVGCGTGRFTREIALQSGAEVVGVDHSYQMVRLARKNVGAVADVRRADADLLPYRAGSFDVAFCFGVLHHAVGEGIAQAVLDEMARVASRVVVVEPNILNPYFFTTTYVWHDLQRRVAGYPRVPHERPLTKGFLRRGLKAAGLKTRVRTMSPVASWVATGSKWSRATEWALEGPLRTLGTHVVGVGQR
jgi:SAM-dependent methyltransferase